jgi:hypothetical protein
MSKPTFPWVEEAVVAVSRDQVKMRMELGLVCVFTNVGEHVEPLGAQHLEKCSTNSLSGFNEGNTFVGLNVKQVVAMLLRDDQAVPARHRQQVHEHHDVVVLEQNFGLHGSGDDPAKRAARLAELSGELFFREELTGRD